MPRLALPLLLLASATSPAAGAGGALGARAVVVPAAPRIGATPPAAHALVALLPLRSRSLPFREPAAVPLRGAAPVTDEIASDDGTLRAAVGVYRDCAGLAPIPSSEAALWPCVPGLLYFVGHNPGVFTPLMHLGVGAGLTYFDSTGARHRFRIVRIEDWRRTDGFPPPASAAVVAQLQTCVTPDATVDRIVDVVAA